MGKKSKYDLAEAKSLFMTFMPVIEIAKQLNIPYKTLVYHSNKWKEERGLLRNEILRELSENKKAILTSLVGNSLECVDRAILDLRNRGRPPTISEARMLTNIIAEVDKILRLDDGNPTDIIAEQKPSTIIELRDKLKRDPFYIEETAYKEIPHEKTTNPASDDNKSRGERKK
tara:strand:- start:313 stop:831 length:519 start_codon:yes stop_codon:yes gene_type:complete